MVKNCKKRVTSSSTPHLLADYSSGLSFYSDTSSIDDFNVCLMTLVSVQCTSVILLFSYIGLLLP